MRGRGRGRGRRRGPRWISQIPRVTSYAPIGMPYQKTVVLTYSEMEALRLVDVEGLTQEEAAARMGVSRKTLWNELKGARKKIVEAIMYGWNIEIRGDENYFIRQE
jgi:predicted DNA-binding protein (UPF0251 family)